ncbi:carboxypeptidase-like regulatory domain-containing protein [Pontibacter sp. SGAir0037]|uniref:carboxypeptidase-like regulatory domain-containing protein n=1 Tax=Pontibacter sp. SGAir0037 TaxID=2571030 RepID=UPI0010CD62DD|nr:carboxypeptidase-like regulatory domain-containing protein [Pontibacter sp. SGAir0037]QCR23569.1 hypothetical protein C1N53_15270 [Pontibacter sp. SGAir0037]
MLRTLSLFILLLMLLFSSYTSFAQRTVRIRGTVLQPDKETPIEGAGILQLGSKTAVASDAGGNFIIDIGLNDTLLIRAVGYKPMLYLPQILLVSEVRANIIMQEDSVMLGEVKVTTRPSEEMIQRAVRNMKQEKPNYTARPGHNPDIKPITPAPPPPPNVVLNPLSAFSKEGRQIRELHKIKKKLEEEKQKKEENARLLEQEEARKKAKELYNSFFKDSTTSQ